MSRVEQNFEIQAKPSTFHQVKTGNVYPAWKWIIIAVPALLFFVLIMLFVILGNNNDSANSTNKTNSLSATVTPIAEVPQFLEDTKIGLNSLDLDQSQLSSPQVDLDVNFR